MGYTSVYFRRTTVVPADKGDDELVMPPRPDSGLAYSVVTPIKVEGHLFGAYVRITEFWTSYVEMTPEYCTGPCSDTKKNRYHTPVKTESIEFAGVVAFDKPCENPWSKP